jgi:uncharacterized protein (DUF885 family)
MNMSRAVAARLLPPFLLRKRAQRNAVAAFASLAEDAAPSCALLRNSPVKRSRPRRTPGSIFPVWSAAPALCGLLASVLASCSFSPKSQPADFDKLSNDLIFGSLALSPVAATQAGLHNYNGVPLDELVDDYSAQGLDSQRKFYEGFQSRVAALDIAALDREQKADLRVINDNLALTLLELNTIQSYKHNPTIYVELAGNAVFGPYMLKYASREMRYQQIIRRMEKLPALFEQAKANLEDSPEVWNRVARDENQGNIDLIDKTLRAEAPESEQEDYKKAADRLVPVLKEFNSYLETTLSKKTSDWRLGKDKYAKKFQFTIDTGSTPEQLLAEAESELQSTRQEMAKLAAPKTVKQALDDIATHHASPETFMVQARADLAQVTAFVRGKETEKFRKDKGLLTVPTRGNLEVTETPEFMRGIYAVGGFVSAPALQPELGAFYWVTPIPKNWTPDRIASKLREYNDYGLQELTIHEAMPGHYVQFEYANDVQPEARRLLRNLWGNNAYIEGWAFYAQQMMSDEGYLNNSKELKLTFYKQALRVLANAILDIRLQTMGMTDKEALDLMMNDTYQEREEATAKLQRAQLSSCQLPTYYAGWKGWIASRDEFRKREAGDYSLRVFHDRALREGAVPIPALQALLR